MSATVGWVYIVVWVVGTALSIGYYTFGGHREPWRPWWYRAVSIAVELLGLWLAIEAVTG